MIGRSGFTLVEITIVIVIIGILATISILPYDRYIDRVHLQSARDTLEQEWKLMHRQVYSGKRGGTGSFLGEIFVFRSGASLVERYIFTATGIPHSFSDSSIERIADLDSSTRVHIASLSPVLGENEWVGYALPPFALSGSFFTGIFVPVAQSGIQITLASSSSDLIHPVRTFLFVP